MSTSLRLSAGRRVQEVGVIGRILAAVAGLCLLAFATSAAAEPRVALVIGNSSYGGGIGKLPNPANDAALMTASLQKTGFDVIKVIDADQKKMKRAIVEFGEKLANAGPKATGLFFYAGHGIQVKGVNYLIPIDAHIEKEADVSIESLTADDVMEQMEFASNAVNIIILDACRNNPISRSMRSASRGLAPMQSDSVRGTFIAYSTAPGSVAADGSGTNSPYSQALAQAIVKPGVGIEEIFRDVRGQVMQATEEKQIPWDSSSLTAPFFFSPNGAQPAAVTNAPAAPNANPEKQLWDYVETSKQPDDYQAYLNQYPNGAYATLARSRLAKLGVAPAAAAAPASATPAAAPAGAKSGAEKAAWDSISASKEPGDYQAYLNQYPQGTYAPLARSRLAELNRTVPAPESAPAAPVDEPASASTSPPAGDSSGGIFGSSPKVEYDSKGVDCRIMDLNRSESECRNTKKPKKPNKPRG
jgi:carboxyl-terminal processing protease